jgi:hypothetical protein
MSRTLTAPLLATLLAAALWSSMATTASAAHPDIFYNYYVSPSRPGGGVPAQLYVSPRPTPPMVGHTFITYPPLMPHEFLYHHHRKYWKYYRNGGYTTASVHYH